MKYLHGSRGRKRAQPKVKKTKKPRHTHLTHLRHHDKTPQIESLR